MDDPNDIFNKIMGSEYGSVSEMTKKMNNDPTWCMGKKFKCKQGMIWRACVQLKTKLFMAVSVHDETYPMNVVIVKVEEWL
jgi:hypothetical protein